MWPKKVVAWTCLVDSLPVEIQKKKDWILQKLETKINFNFCFLNLKDQVMRLLSNNVSDWKSSVLLTFSHIRGRRKIHHRSTKMHKNIIIQDKFDGNRMISFLCKLFQGCCSFFSCVIQINCALDGQTRIFQNLFSIVNISAFNSDNQRYFKINDTFIKHCIWLKIIGFIDLFTYQGKEKNTSPQHKNA